VTTAEIRDLLARHTFFAELEPGDLDLIAGCGRNVVFPAGSTIARTGEPANLFFVVREGRIAMEVDTPGRGSLVVDTAGPGGVVGWSWLFPPYEWSFDARAAAEVHAIALDGACLRGKCDRDPALGYRLMKRFSAGLADRLEATRLRLLDLYGDPDTAPINESAGAP
jgi:CRP/FNR family transcriptional regulator, cyclic AMP receptor protein